MNHTITLVIGTNAIVVNDHGRRERNYIFPMLIWRVWVPAFLIGAIHRFDMSAHTWWAVAFGPGWKGDLAVIVEAVRLWFVGPRAVMGL